VSTPEAIERHQLEQLYWQAEILVRAVADQPGDPEPRLALANWLEARGLVREALGQRWAARRNKYPARPGQVPNLVGGWYIEGTRPDLADAHLLPPFFWRRDSRPDQIAYRDLNEPLPCERWFLEACGRIEWSRDGEPLRQPAANALGTVAPDDGRPEWYDLG
jgi:hypothetical protein